MNSIELNSNRDSGAAVAVVEIYLFRFANRCVPRFFQGCKRRDGDRRRDSALSSVAGASYRMQRVAASTVVSACSGQIAREREGEREREREWRKWASERANVRKSEETRKGEEGRWMENSELTRRREITALSLPRYSCTLHHDCATVVAVKDIDERGERTSDKLVVSFLIRQPINFTSHFRFRKLKQYSNIRLI